MKYHYWKHNHSRIILCYHLIVMMGNCNFYQAGIHTYQSDIGFAYLKFWRRVQDYDDNYHCR